MRRPQDTIAQRQLVYQLALAVDNCMMAVNHRGSAERKLDELLDANPRSVFSTHVIHNIGARRARWLTAYSIERARRAHDAMSI